MTKEQAIDHLKADIKYWENTSVSVDHLEMAIKALEQQPIAEERYQDLIEYFGDKDIAKCVLEDREEFKKWLERIKWHVRKANELARKLEQQPSDDCISRKAVIDLINADWKYEGLELSINELPPVTPTRKVGKWEYTGSYIVEGLLKCTICGHEIDVSEGYYKFCPMCGADMRGSENG